MHLRCPSDMINKKVNSDGCSHQTLFNLHDEKKSLAEAVKASQFLRSFFFPTDS